MSPAAGIGHLGSIGSNCVRRRNGGAPRLVVFETWDARRLASEGVRLMRLAVVGPHLTKAPLLAKSARNGAPRLIMMLEKWATRLLFERGAPL